MDKQSFECEESIYCRLSLCLKQQEIIQKKVLHLSNESDDDVKEQESQTARLLKILTDTIQVLHLDEKVIDERITKKKRQMAEFESRLFS